ncbi:hypothetical protein TNCV_3473761 [Trichonephila clavipes]|nr:hypothetical protein TNCV_3473761 [Trichonephila clavipes]
MQMVNICRYPCAAFCFASVAILAAVLTSFTELYCQRLWIILSYHEQESSLHWCKNTFTIKLITFKSLHSTFLYAHVSLVGLSRPPQEESAPQLEKHCTRHNQSKHVERHNYGGRGIMVWEEISLDGDSDLHVILGEILTGVRYRDVEKIPDISQIAGKEFRNWMVKDSDLLFPGCPDRQKETP